MSALTRGTKEIFTRVRKEFEMIELAIAILKSGAIAQTFPVEDKALAEINVDQLENIRLVRVACVEQLVFRYQALFDEFEGLVRARGEIK